MGKIVVKAQQQMVFNKDKSGVKSNAYVLRPVRYTTMNSNDIVNYCAANSIVPKAYLSASMVALAQCIENFLLNGHSVEFPNLGIFSLSSRGISEIDVNKAGIAQLNKLNVRFLPCTQLKTEVENVDLEFDGVYDIAGENEEGTKYYRKVVRHLTASGSEDNNPGGGNEDEDEGGDPTPKKTVTLTVSPAGAGTVTGGGQYDSGASVNIKATPASGYHFVKWSDNITSATRTVTVNSDLTLQAIFAADAPQGGGEDEDNPGGGGGSEGEDDPYNYG